MSSQLTEKASAMSTDGQPFCQLVIGFDTLDPYALFMNFETPNGNIKWTIGRELVNRAVRVDLEMTVGEGDVSFCRHLLGEGAMDVVELGLRSPDGEMSLLIPTQKFASVVEQSYELVTADGAAEAAAAELDRMDFSA